MHTPLITLSLDLGGAKPTISAFRSAFIQLRRFEADDWFHNHFTEEGNYRVHNRYAFVQYKQVGDEFVVLCMSEAVRLEVLEFFYTMPRVMNLYQKEVPFRVMSCKYEEFPFEMSPMFEYEYEINDYIALNGDNYQKFRKIATHSERAIFLQNILANHLVAYIKAVNIPREMRPYRIETVITSEPKMTTKNSNDHEVLTFHFSFKTNLRLPNYLGLGKDTAKGMGIIVSKNEG